MMKIKCRYCKKEIEIDEKDYAPGEVVSIECERCGEENEVTIPAREESSEKKSKETKAKVVRKADVLPEPSEESISLTPQENVSVNSEEENVSKPRTQARGRAGAPKKDTPKEEKKDSTSPKKDTPKKETKEPKEEVNLKPDHKRKRSTNTTNQTNRPPIRRQPPVYVEQKNSQSGIPAWVLIFLGILVVVGIILLFRSCGGHGSSNKEGIYDSCSDIEVRDTVSYMERYDEPDTVAVVAEDTIGYDGNDDENETTDESVTPIYIPSASNFTSSEAYDVYSAYIPDEKIGEDWESSEAVRRARENGYIECMVKGDGNIDGYPFSIEGVRLKNGRLLGRYINNTNGVKLDMNGAFDSNGNLILRLGHKNETSYFVLEYSDSYRGVRSYEGTWGKTDRIADLDLRQIHR